MTLEPGLDVSVGRVEQKYDGFCSIADIEFGQDLGHMMFDRLFLQAKFDGNLFVAKSLGNNFQNSSFSIGELTDQMRLAIVRLHQAGEEPG